MVSAARPVPLPSPVSERVARAWHRHPLVSFLRHSRQLAFYRQFHELHRAGLSLPVAFAELARFAPSAGAARALEAMSRDVQAGATLADALGRHAALLGDANVELIAFAEEAGTLERVLGALIAHLEEVQRLRWQALMMSVWPMYLAAGVLFVEPLLSAARSVQGPSDIGGRYVSGLTSNLLWALLVGGGLFAAPLVISALDVERPWDALKRQAPLVSAPLSRLYTSRLVTALGLGLGAGLEVVRALRVAVRVTGSPSLLASLPAAEALLRRGGTLTDAVESLALLDRATLGTLAVAERTGTLDDTLARVGREQQASSLRAMRLLLLALFAALAGVMVLKAVAGILGVLLGPVKTLYDAAGSGKLDAIGGP
jgi:type IV pilus assembly protein PilC